MHDVIQLATALITLAGAALTLFTRINRRRYRAGVRRNRQRPGRAARGRAATSEVAIGEDT